MPIATSRISITLGKEEAAMLRQLVRATGKAEGRIGNFNSWPIDMLQPGDVYVCLLYTSPSPRD